MATPVASLPALLLVIVIVTALAVILSRSPPSSESEDITTSVYRYQAVRMTPGGPAVCASDNPTATHVGLIISQCSTKCSRNDNCLYYNYRITPNQQPVCQLFDFQPQSVAPQEDCVLYAVSKK